MTTTHRNVRFVSKADIGEGATDVHFTPKGRHSLERQAYPLCAKSRHMLCSNHVESAFETELQVANFWLLLLFENL